MRFTTSLTKNHEFRRLYNKGKSVAARCVVIYCLRNRYTGNRLGVTVSTKIGGAVVRNKVRRRLKEIYRLNENELTPGYDIVIVARTKSRYVGYQELENSVLTTMKKLNIIKNTTARGEK